MGGAEPLKFHSIRLVDKQLNFRWYLKALALFNLAITGDFLAEEDKKKVTRVDYKIVAKLCKYLYLDPQENHKEPIYIVQLFKEFVSSKKIIHINLKYLFKEYKGFTRLLLETINVGVQTNFNKKRKTNVMPNVRNIIKIFRDCRTIIIDYKRSGKSNLQASFFYSLIDHLKKLQANNKCKLMEIRVLNAKYLNGKFDKSFRKYAAFIADYKAIGWRFHIEEEGKKLMIKRFDESE